MFFLLDIVKKMVIETDFPSCFHSSLVVDRQGTNNLGRKFKSLDFRTTFEKMFLQGSFAT